MAKERRTAIALVLITAAAAAVAGLLYSTGSADLMTQDRQPIAFSHQVHAGELNMACLYCHRYATTSPTAAVPTVSLCMSCHRSMDTNNPDIKKLVGYWERKEPIPWVRLQRLPDFVYFTHEMHVKGRLQCADCHGRVEQMQGTPRAPTYEMGWCLTCHRQRSVSDDCWTCHK